MNSIKMALLIAVLGVCMLFLSAGSSIFADGSKMGQKNGGGDGSALVEQFKRVSASVGALYTNTSGGDLKFTCTVTVIEHQKKSTVLFKVAASIGF